MFVLEHDVRTVDPRIAQRLIGLHAANGRPDRAERVIWRIDPACLDIDQVVQLCQTHRLYDALIYVYTRAMRDYVAPVVEMLSLLRKEMQMRRAQPVPDEAALEPLVVDAYKVYPYLADVLSGLTYPSEEALDVDEARKAKRDLYAFLFNGRSDTWPRGDGGRLVLTAVAEEDRNGGGVEPTYPYCRLLLRFDAEAFLHALDLAFEDSYFNDDATADGGGGTSRLVIIKILLEILASSSSPPSLDLPPTARTFVHIFVARNVPKYPQSIQMVPSVRSPARHSRRTHDGCGLEHARGPSAGGRVPPLDIHPTPIRNRAAAAVVRGRRVLSDPAHVASTGETMGAAAPRIFARSGYPLPRAVRPRRRDFYHRDSVALLRWRRCAE
jgi:hypothetical protein